MKIAPIVAGLVVLSSLAYAEKPPAPPRETKPPPNVDRSKQPVRPLVRPGPATPPVGPRVNPKAPSDTPRVVVVTGEEDNSASGAKPKPATDAEINKALKNGTQVQSSKAPGIHALVSDDKEGGVEDDVETGTEAPTSGSQSADPAARRSAAPPALKWELSELDAAKKSPPQKPAAAAPQTPPTAASSSATAPKVIKKPATIKSETEVMDTVRAPR